MTSFEKESSALRMHVAIDSKYGEFKGTNHHGRLHLQRQRLLLGR